MNSETRAWSIVLSSVPFYNSEGIFSMGPFGLTPVINSSSLRDIPSGRCPSMLRLNSLRAKAMDGMTAIQSWSASFNSVSIDLLSDKWIELTILLYL